jgi:2,3-dihydroxy-2,3-dihydrophenylpropionate dehydrogenase
MRPRDELAGRSVVVTGGTSGIGRALTERLAGAGAHVVVLDLHPDPELASRDGVEVVPGDVVDPEANRRAVDAARDATGDLAAFVGNAGVHDAGRGLLDLSPAELDRLSGRVLDVNVRGYLQGARAAAGELRRSGGVMVFTLSDASFHVSRVGSGICYTVSKHAALGVVRALAAELAPDVRVNAVAPGGVLTGLRAVDPDDPSREHGLFHDPAALERQVRSINPLGTVLTVDDLVPHYLFLLSSASAGLTGHVLRPDGGLEVS